jgi:exopolysaccharide production protein ExoQ
LFWLDRDSKARTSFALWVPSIWILLVCSRAISQWMTRETLYTTGDVAEGNPIDRMAQGVLIGLAVLILSTRWKRLTWFLRGNVPILLFFFYCLLSVAWSDYPDIAFKRWTKAIGDFLMILVVMSDPEPFTAVKRLIARGTYILIPLSVLCIKYLPQYGKAYGRWDYKAYYVGVTTSKNSLGAICLIFGLGALWRIWWAYNDREDSGRWRRIAAHLAVLAMIGYLFKMANSMTSLMCFALASPLIFTGFNSKMLRLPVLVHTYIGTITVSTVSALFFATSVLTVVGRDPTLTDRTGVWSAVLKMTGNPLLGWGFESFWLGPRLARMWTLYTWQPNQSHNGYIEIFVNLGWMGVVLLAVVLTVGYGVAVQSFRRNLPTGGLVLAFFAAGLIYNCTEAAYFRMMTPMWVFFLLAITKYNEVRVERRVFGGGTIEDLKAFYLHKVETSGQPLWKPPATPASS